MTLLSLPDLHDYQKRAINFQVANPSSMLFLGMGLGKTVITLTTAAHLIRHGVIKSVLILAPLRVIHSTWIQEAAKWEHLKHLTFSSITGKPDRRMSALFQPADIYLINYEGLQWLSAQLTAYFPDGNLPFDMLVCDEISKCKNPTTNRVQALLPHLSAFDYRTGLTGTPCGSGYLDLFGEYLVIDSGQRLGTSIESYRNAYFTTTGYKGYNYLIKPGMESVIHDTIIDITVEMSSDDYLQMPDISVYNIHAHLSPKARKFYDQMERDLFVELDTGTLVDVESEVGKIIKCIAFGTDVLTDAGWVPIQNLNGGELIWDGLEWVSYYGVVSQGVQDVVNCFNVGMTKEHKVLTSSGWFSAEDIINGKPEDEYVRHEVRSPHCNEILTKCVVQQKEYITTRHVGVFMRLWEHCIASRHKFTVKAQKPHKELRVSPRGQYSNTRYDWYTTMGYVDEYAIQVFETTRQGLQKLWRAWHNCMYNVGEIVYQLLGGDVSRLQGQLDTGANRQQRNVHKRKLQMGNTERPGFKQKKYGVHRNPRGENPTCGSFRSIQYKSRHIISKVGAWLLTRGYVETCKLETYDLVNSGPRSRFTVRGKCGTPMIVHNCLQLANGNLITETESGEWEAVHDAKLEVLDDIIEEAAGMPIMLAYNFRADAARIMKKFPHAVNLTGLNEKEFNHTLSEFAAGNIRLLLGSSQGVAFGVDGLQKGTNILVFYGISWSLEHYTQMLARIHRQGQERPVSVYRILAPDTFDMVVADRLESKGDTQAGLLKAIANYRKQRS